MVPCEKLPKDLLPPLTKVNTPKGDVRRGMENFLKEVPSKLMEMFGIRSYKIIAKTGQLLFANGDPVIHHQHYHPHYGH
jgi:hypothetical protein